MVNASVTERLKERVANTQEHKREETSEMLTPCCLIFCNLMLEKQEKELHGLKRRRDF